VSQHPRPSGDPLTRALGAGPPPGVASLPDDVRDRLADQLTRRRETLLAEGRAATDHALRHVPLPVRGLVRRTLS